MFWAGPRVALAVALSAFAAVPLCVARVPASAATAPPTHFQWRLPTAAPAEWRGVTAFRLVEMIARGREAQAREYLDWAAAHDLTVVRTLTMARHLFQLSPQEGAAALPRLLELAGERRLSVEVVALADTAAIPTNLEAHVSAVGAVVSRFPNAVLEIANEPGHPSQDRRLHDPRFALQLASVVADRVHTSLGSAEYDPLFASGDYATFHFPRRSDEGGWGHVLELASGAALVERWRKPVISDEPIGAGDMVQPGRRDNAPARFAAAAVVTRLAGMGATFHYDDGLHARIPAGVQRVCFEAWRKGLGLARELPPGGTFLAGDAVINQVARVTGARAVFARKFEREAWVAAVDPSANVSVAWGDGWRQRQEPSMVDGVRVYRAVANP